MAIIYDLLQLTWGLPQTILGFIYFLLNIKREHYYHGSVVTIWKSKSSLSLGMFVFVSDDPFCYYESLRETYSEGEFSNMFLVHEYGHTIQSLFFGPLYLLLVGVPSIMWSFLPVYVRESVIRSTYHIFRLIRNDGRIHWENGLQNRNRLENQYDKNTVCLLGHGINYRLKPFVFKCFFLKEIKIQLIYNF